MLREISLEVLESLLDRFSEEEILSMNGDLLYSIIGDLVYFTLDRVFSNQFNYQEDYSIYIEVSEMVFEALFDRV